ncbi:hypothetical protein FRC00_009343, partial [Tulasnella sp. 408]
MSLLPSGASPSDVAQPVPMEIDGDADHSEQESPSNFNANQMLFEGVPSDSKMKKLTVRARLERLSKYRIYSAAIWATAEPIGSGGKARVVQAECQQLSGGTAVAAKQLLFGGKSEKEKTSKEFVHEVEILAGLSHENIVQLIGFVEDLEIHKAWIVLSWAPHGNVREFLASGNWEIPERISLSGMHMGLTHENLQIQDMFKGLEYLHTRRPPIRHGDLKSLNILVSSSYRAMITDFGSARQLRDADNQEADQGVGQTAQKAATTTEFATRTQTDIKIMATAYQLTLTGPACSLRWAAPEVVNAEEDLCLSSDIWSAAWVCWEVGKIEGYNGDDQGRAHTFQGLGDIYFGQSRYPEAEECYVQARDIYILIDDDQGRAHTLRGLADIHRFQSKYSEAEGCYAQARDIYARIGNDQERAHTSQRLGDVYRGQCKYLEAKLCYVEARDIYIRIGDDQCRMHTLLGLEDVYIHIRNNPGRARTLHGLGGVYHGQSRYLEAERCYTQARDIYNLIEDTRGRASTLYGLGDVYCGQSKYREAEECYTQAREIYINTGDDEGHAHTLQGMGDVQRAQCNFLQAEVYLTQARDIYVRLGHENGRFYTLRRLENIYLFTGKAQERAHTLRGLGDIYRRQSEYLGAEKYYTQAQELYTQIGDDLGLAQTLHGLGDVR